MIWAQLLAYVTGAVNQELLSRNEYLAAENRILSLANWYGCRGSTQTLFWTAADLEDKLQAFQRYFNKHRTHSGLEGPLPEPGEEKVTLNFASYRWKQHCRGLYQTPTAA